MYRQAIFARAECRAEKKKLGCTWANWAFEHSHLTGKFGGTKLSSAISISHLQNINRAGTNESHIERRHFIFTYIMILCVIVRQVFELPPCMEDTPFFYLSCHCLVAVLMQQLKAVVFITWHAAWNSSSCVPYHFNHMSQRDVPLLVIVLMMIRVSKLRWD